MKNVLIAATFALCATAASAEVLSVDGEDGATYEVLSVIETAGVKAVVTKRSGNGDTKVSMYLVNCDPYRVGLAGTGPTRDAMDKNVVPNPNMSEVIRFSAEDVIAGYACAK